MRALAELKAYAAPPVFLIPSPLPSSPRMGKQTNPLRPCSEGKIKYIGLSAISSRTLLRALKIAHVDAVQSDYSVFERQIEGPAGTDLLAVCRAHGVALVAAMPLNRGVLTSNFAAGEFGQGDMRGKVMPRFLPENRSKNEKIVRDFEKIAEKKGCSVAQLSLAWLLAQGYVMLTRLLDVELYADEMIEMILSPSQGLRRSSISKRTGRLWTSS